MSSTPTPSSTDAIQPTASQKGVFAHFQKEFGSPTKGSKLAIVGLIFCMMQMSKGMHKDKSLIDQQLNNYIFAQNLNGAKNLGDVYRVCMDYVISGNPEARELVTKAADALNVGHKLDEHDGMIGALLDEDIVGIVQQTIVPQLQTMLDDSKGKPQSEAMKSALSFVKGYADQAADEIAFGGQIDPHTATIELNIYTNMGQQMENSTKNRIGELKNLATNLKEMMQNMMTLTKANQQ